jgi:DNA-binding cell septation regulator SpoVG
MTEISVSDVQIFPIRPKNGLIAFASCIINGAIYIGNIALFTSFTNPLGFRLAYPNKRLPNGQDTCCAHPITKEAGLAISKAIIEKYRQISTKSQGNNKVNNGVKKHNGHNR